MGGVGLGRLWGSHPRVAFVLHLLFTLLAGYATFAVASGGAGWGTLFVFVAFLLMAASLVFLTWAAIQSGWQPDDSYPSTGGQVVAPGVAWANTNAPGRIIWTLFAVAFLSALVLLLAKSIVGVALILIALLLAIVAMRLD